MAGISRISSQEAAFCKNTYISLSLIDIREIRLETKESQGAFPRKMIHGREERRRLKARAAALSIVSNTVLVVMKIAVGLLIGSVSILSEAIHSGVDLLAAVMAFIAVRVAGRPADDSHPFGHGKVENLCGTLEALLIFLAAGWIMAEAWDKIMQPRPLESAGWGAAVMLISVVANTAVSRRLFHVSMQTDSVALAADAWHLRTDVYTSLGVMAGLGAIWLGGLLFPQVDLSLLDPLAAMAVALLILKAAWEMTLQSGRDLLDAGLPGEERKLIREHVAELSPMARGLHGLKTRKSGGLRFAEFHMLVDAQMSVEESHRLTEVMSDSIREHYPCTVVTIHIEPCDGSCPKSCKSNCLLTEEQRKDLHVMKGGNTT
ncbi:MAG TPA: cation diffusion facilitator family transporter [Methanotrichaceae archaeon]|nr:cation diffusion facilitator family transporter [Methanotrichaceae archaeon]HQJ28277.1 cation diffusion facilitator family transporter [Methanotrichaceae archaeon]